MVNRWKSRPADSWEKHREQMSSRAGFIVCRKEKGWHSRRSVRIFRCKTRYFSKGSWRSDDWNLRLISSTALVCWSSVLRKSMTSWFLCGSRMPCTMDLRRTFMAMCAFSRGAASADAAASISPCPTAMVDISAWWACQI